MPADHAVQVTPLKIARTTALLLTGYVTTGAVMVLTSRLRNPYRPPPPLPPYPAHLPRQRQAALRRVAA